MKPLTEGMKRWVERSCTRKKRFDKMSSAQLSMAKLKLAKKLNVYECTICGGYHIGHKIPERIRKNQS